MMSVNIMFQRGIEGEIVTQILKMKGNKKEKRKNFTWIL